MYSDTAAVKDTQAMQDLVATIAESEKLRTSAQILKVEGMLVHAAKTKLKKTQRELVQVQMTEIAATDELEESMLQPALLAFAKSLMV